MDNTPFIRNLALALDKTGSVMNGQQVANELNINNRTTTYDDTYSGDRGTYTLIHATYDWLKGLEELQKLILSPGFS